MKTRFVQIVFTLVVTILGAALQDMLPSFGGTKPPVLLAMTLSLVFSEPEADMRDRRTAAPFFANGWIPMALLAGAFEDALSGFPTGCAVGFIVLAGATARLFRSMARFYPPLVCGLVATMAAAPCHELWLCMWGVVGNAPSGFVRFFASALPAAPTGALIFMLMPWLARITGFHGVATGRFA